MKFVDEATIDVAAGNGGSDGVGDNNDTTASYPGNYSTTAAVGYESVISVASLTSSGGLSSGSAYIISCLSAPSRGLPGALYSQAKWPFSQTSAKHSS